MLFDVVAISLQTNVVRLVAEKKSKEDADALVSMAVMQNGVDNEFFASVSAGAFRSGDQYIMRGAA